MVFFIYAIINLEVASTITWTMSTVGQYLNGKLLTTVLAPNLRCSCFLKDKCLLPSLAKSPIPTSPTPSPPPPPHPLQ